MKVHDETFHDEGDDLIEEIHEVRRRISARFDHEPERLVAYYVERQKRHQDLHFLSSESKPKCFAVPQAQAVTVDEEALTVDLVDGRTLIVPLIWFPRLRHGTPEERDNFEIVGDGTFLHWPELDEDLSVAGLLSGLRSGESPESLKEWLAARASRAKSR
ncbi:MAG TPA: DUF2442 domain-containing protein [Thermoanaerobaculia bacterium]|nr:DUF2442 domain-containing protein [Thermoanaerobaculia bacterium]